MTIRSTELSDVIDLGITRRLKDARTAIPGTVDAIDLAAQTVDVRIDIQDVTELQDETNDDGSKLFFESKEIAILQEVPIGFTRTRTHAVLLPMGVGDRVLVIFCDRDIGSWYANQSDSSVVPDDLGTHGYGGAIAIPMVYPKSLALSDVSSSKIRIGASGGSWVAVADATKVKAELDKLQTQITNLATHTHPTAVGPSGPPTPVPSYTASAVACSDVEVT